MKTLSDLPGCLRAISSQLRLKAALAVVLFVASIALTEVRSQAADLGLQTAAANNNKVWIFIPGNKGVLGIDVGPTSWNRQVRPDGREVKLEAMGRPDDLLITAFLQRVDFAASPERCRKEWWPQTKKGAQIKHDDLHETEVKDGIARVEFILHKFRDQPLEQKTLHGYLGSGNLCAEVHLSKVQFQPGDQKLFEDVLATVRLLPDMMVPDLPPMGEELKSYLAQASRYYLQRDYAAAAPLYQKVLDLEKQKRTLHQDLFRMVVDNLGMSYGLSHDLPRAKETFEYGITQDAEYPMYYYNLACTYGEMGKMEEALAQLHLAYKYRANMIPGEGPVPDPLQDDSFRDFVKNDAFVRAVREMQH